MVDFADVLAAHQRIRSFVHRTPVMRCTALDAIAGARLFFKCENLQKAGAFKSRGAVNAVFSLSDEAAARGVVTHSSGNHAAALARAARLRGIPARIVMPENAPAVKIAAVEAYGGAITFCQPTLEAREETARRVLDETGGVLVHPYDDERIIAGQGTTAVELIEQSPPLDAIIAPVGGGGLLSGCAIAAKAMRPRIAIWGAEPAAADDTKRSLEAGKIIPVGQTDTIADGLRTSLGERTFPIIHKLADDILLASEEAILDATQLILERAKLVVEPSAAVPLAALLENQPPLAGKNVGVILSGGNLDWRRLAEIGHFSMASM